MKGYRDPKSTVIQDWKWKPLRKVQEKFDLTEIPSHVEKFGEFMDETARRAAEHGLTPRDLVKAYTLTRFSIQRTARKALILRKAGLVLPSGVDDQDRVRPEGAFGHWLHTKHGQRYLDKAEAGEVDEEAIADAQQKLRTFGKVDKDLPDALRWAPKNLPGQEARVSELVRRSMKGQSDPSEWRNEMRGLRGIRSAKAGFIAAQLGRGDQPTLDARQIVEHTGQPSKAATKYTNRSGGLGATEAVERLAARQTAMNLKLPKEMQPNYQHLAHHAFWDAAEGEQTTHQDVMDAMRTAARGGRITRADGGRSESSKIPLQEHLLRAMEMAGFGRDAEKLRNRDPQQVMQALEKIHTPFSDSPESREKAKGIVGAYRVTTDPRLVKDNRYYGIQHELAPKDVTETIKPIRGVVPKDKVTRPWQHLYSEGKGGTLIGLGGDRTRQGMLTHINGKKLAWPVRLDAGMDYMRELNPGAVWKSAPGATTKLQNKIREAAKTGPVYGAFSPMGATSGDSSVHMFETLMSQMRDSGMSATTKTAFDRSLKRGEHVPIVESKENSEGQRAKAIDIMKKWPGLANPREAAKFAAGLSGEHRALIVKHMDNKTWHERGMPHVGITRVAITEPELRETPGNTIGPRIVRFDPDRIAEETRLKHGTYRGAPPIAGTYWGDTAPLQSHHVMPDPVFERMMTPTGKKAPVIAHPFSEDAYGRGTWDKIRQLHNPVQPINEQWADSVGAAEEQHARYGFADGGQVDDPLAQMPTPGMGHNQPPEAMPAPASYIKPVDEDKRRLTPLGFYSHAAEAVWKQPMMKASPAQFKATLLNKHGVKPDEFKWSGYDQAFDGRDYVTKKEVRDHFIKNLPKVDEQRYSDDDYDYADDTGASGGPEYQEYSLPGGKNYRELVMHLPKKEHPDLFKAKQAHREAIAARGAAAQEKVRASAMANDMFKRARAGASDDELDAARDRAVIANREHREASERVEEAKAQVNELEGQGNYKSGHWKGVDNPLLHLRVSDRAGEPVNRYVWGNKTSGNVTKEFVSEKDARDHLERLPESLRPNLELRVKKRPMKILHVEEMQSDWGQDARDRGFKEDHEKLTQQMIEAERKLNVAHQTNKSEEEKEAALVEFDRLQDAHAKLQRNGVPSAPYVDKTGKWAELGLKRILHEAATGGYDRIIFTPGSEQAKRYDLSDQVKELHYSPEEKLLSFRKGDEYSYNEQDVPPDELHKHIGRELADKLTGVPAKKGPLLETPYHSLVGKEDMTVGGEGMKGFYDKIVPTTLEKLAKQHDPEAKVKLFSHALPKAPQRASGEDVMNTLGIDRDAQDTYWRALTPEMREQHFAEHHRRAAEDKHHLHALDITPKMRDSIRKGQRAYAAGGRVGKAVGGTLDMGSMPYSTNTSDVPGGTAQRGKDALALAGSGGDSDAPAPGSGRDFLNQLANDPKTDGMTRLFAAGMAKSGTFSGQDPSKPEPAVVDPNAKPDYPVIRAAGGRVCPVKAAWKQPKLKASPSEFKKILTKQGVDPDEIEQSGYDDAFKDRAFVSKREVRDHFARATGGRIEERVYQKVRKAVPVAGRYP